MYALLAWLVACSPSDLAAYPVGTPVSALPPPGVCNPGEVALGNGVPYPDIQSALSAVGPVGGTVTVCAGTHVVNSLTLWSWGGPVLLTGETSDPADTVLSGYLSTNLLHLQGLGHTIQNLTFSNAIQSAIYAQTVDQPVTIDNCVFDGNQYDYSPVVKLLGSDNTVTHTIFRNNRAPGILYASTLLWVSADRRFHLEDVVFEDNVSSNAPVATLGIQSGTWGADGSLFMSGVEFRDNQSTMPTLAIGAGGSVLSAVQTVDVDHLTMIGNTSASGAAGLLVETQPFGTLEVNLSDSQFIDNEGGRSSSATGAALNLRGYAPPSGFTDRFEVALDRVQFGINRNDGAFSRDAAVLIDPRFRVTWSAVDFGAGAWRNFPAELSGCRRRLGMGVSGTTDALARDVCP